MSLGFAEASQIFKLSVHHRVALLKTFSEQFEVCFYLKYLRTYEVSKSGDNSFETDFRSMAESIIRQNPGLQYSYDETSDETVSSSKSGYFLKNVVDCDNLINHHIIFKVEP